MARLSALCDLAGRTALVTGASSGIGWAIAEALAGAGAALVLVARRREQLEAKAQALRDAGSRAAAVSGDLAERETIARIAGEAEALFGPPEILVNAAGCNPRLSAEQVTAETWDRTIELNLRAPFFLAQRLVPAMREKKWGRILNIASLQSMRAFPNGLAYGASKGGIMQLTRAMAEAWSRDGVTCNAIAPGFFPSALTAPLFADPAMAENLAAQTMIGRNGRMEDLYGVAIFLASPASDYITGQTIFVDGGWSAR